MRACVRACVCVCACTIFARFVVLFNLDVCNVFDVVFILDERYARYMYVSLSSS